MSPALQRVLGAAGTVAVGGAVNIGTGLLTDHRQVVWWVSGTVVLLLGVLIQWWLPIPVGRPELHLSRNTAGGSLRQESDRDASLRTDDNDVGGDLHQRLTGDGDMTASGNKVKSDIVQKRT